MPLHQRIIVWTLLALCVAAVPLSRLPRETAEVKSKERISKSELLLPVDDRLLVVKINGMIADLERESILTGGMSIAAVKRALRKAIKDDRVKGVLVRINSPGGTVGTSQEIHHLISELRKTKKPVVASMADVAASGGYYVACACEKIVTEPGTITGSIGVIMHWLNLQGIAQKLGIAETVVKSGKFKDIGSPARPLTPEERSILQGVIMDTYDQFVTAVAQGRALKMETVLKLADGRIYSGRQAVKNGLADSLGGYDEALALLQQMAKERYGIKKDLSVDEGSIFDNLLQALQSASTPGGNLLDGVMPRSISAVYNKVPLWLME